MATVSPTRRWWAFASSACTPTVPGPSAWTEPDRRSKSIVCVAVVSSTAEVFFTLPSTVVFRYRSAVTAPVSGRASIRFVTSGLIPPMPNCVSTIQSAFIALSIDVAMLALADAANTVMKATRATPIISADAAEAVRRGFRDAFSRARVPGIPRKRGSRTPRPRDSGRAMTGPSTTSATKTPSAPRPTVATVWAPSPAATA